MKRGDKDKTETAYQRLANELCEVDVSDLTLKGQDVKLDEFKRYPITEFGLPEDVAALFARLCRDKGHTVSVFQISDAPPEMEGPGLGGLYGLQYDWEDAGSVEHSVWISEKLRAIATGIERAKAILRERESRGLDSDPTDLARRARAFAFKRIREREEMQKEIDEGLRRILGPYPRRGAPMNLEGITLVRIPNGRGWTQLAFHGDQLRDLIRYSGVYRPATTPDLAVVGHFHLQMVVLRQSIPVVFTGHLVPSRVPRRPGMISHVGFPSITYGRELSIWLTRGPFN